MSSGLTSSSPMSMMGSLQMGGYMSPMGREYIDTSGMNIQTGTSDPSIWGGQIWNETHITENHYNDSQHIGGHVTSGHHLHHDGGLTEVSTELMDTFQVHSHSGMYRS